MAFPLAYPANLPLLLQNSHSSALHFKRLGCKRDSQSCDFLTRIGTGAHLTRRISAQAQNFGQFEDVEEDYRPRPLAHFPPDIWGDRFDNFTLYDKLKMERYAKEIEPLKEEVKMMLFDDCGDLAKKMNLIDTVERLGFSYYYKNEIKELLERIFRKISEDNFHMDNNLFDTSVQFRIFRQHGYNVPCDVFNKFTNNEGKFNEILMKDERGMISLYEATHLRVHGEYILEEALVFSTNFLKNIATSSEPARQALMQPLHRGIQRLQSRHFITLYEQVESRNETLLKLAKTEFNRLQLLHCQELSEIQKWWKKFDFARTLPHVRQRSVEAHFTSIIMYYEPEYSFARMLFTKYFLFLLVLDDTYDAYGTFEELKHLTDALDRWELNSMEQFPADCVKIVYDFAFNTYNEFFKEITKEGKSYVEPIFKKQVLKIIRNYFIEAEWMESRYLPTFEEYMVNRRVTCGVQSCAAASMLGMEEVTEAKPYEQLEQALKVVVACENLIGLSDDIVTGEAEIARGVRLVSSVECYMKDYNMSREEVLKTFKQMIEDAWKDLTTEGFRVHYCTDDPDNLSKPLFDRVLNLARVANAFLAVADAYTFVKFTVKEGILAVYDKPFSI